LSLKSIIAAYEKQRLVVFVTLISTRLMGSVHAHSVPELLQALQDSDGQPDRSEVQALAATLQEHGLLLRLVDKNLRRAAIIGTPPALASVPSVVIDGQNLTHIKDWFSGAAATASGVALGAGFIVTIALAGPTTLAAAPTVLLLGGSFALGAAAGALVGLGINEMLYSDPPPPRSNSPQSDSTPNEVGPNGEGGGTIEIPNSVAIGSPPDGLDTGDLLQELGDFSLDFVLADIPVGWDEDAGQAFPGLGGGVDGGDGGDFDPFG